MTGVEILSETIVYETTTTISAISFWCPIIIGMILSAILIITDCIVQHECSPLCVFIMIVAIVSGAALGIETLENTDTIDYIEYKVTISDEVSMNEFLEQYDIIDQEGKIYVVREKGWDN